MANGAEKMKDDYYYKVLGLEKECTQTELKNSYRNLAKKWHPDRCSASGNSKFVEEATNKFQDIQEAYSVLSDETKRLLYDVGVYDNDDDENNHGMGDFLNEMVTMMNEQQPSGNGEESFEELQELFDDIFQRDNHDAFASSSSSYDGPCMTNKRNSSQMNNIEGSPSFNSNLQSFSLGMECMGGSTRKMGIIETSQRSEGSNSINGGNSSRRRHGRKQKISSGHDVSSNDYSGIST